MSGRILSISDGRKRVDPAGTPRARIRGPGRLFAEIIEDRQAPEVVHFVVQRQGSPEILSLGQAKSRLEAEFAACAFMADYSSKRKRPRKLAA